MRISTIAVLLTAAALTVTATGCAGRAELIPNSESTLRKTAAEFAADAAKRHPYKAQAENGGQAPATAEIGYVFDRIDLLNTGGEEMDDVELWINESYVVFLSKLPGKKIISVPFQAIYNDTGTSFPTGNGKLFNREPVLVKKLDIYRDGKMYNVPFAPAD